MEEGQRTPASNCRHKLEGYSWDVLVAYCRMSSHHHTGPEVHPSTRIVRRRVLQPGDPRTLVSSDATEVFRQRRDLLVVSSLPCSGTEAKPAGNTLLIIMWACAKEPHSAGILDDGGRILGRRQACEILSQVQRSLGMQFTKRVMFGMQCQMTRMADSCNTFKVLTVTVSVHKFGHSLI
ncbi:hypothetical protein BD413DRAFT_89766 [Trametes elegans]|nr:hypothetical protein BD413DRAFT_89766 [Trametes elegans]